MRISGLIVLLCMPAVVVARSGAVLLRIHESASFQQAAQWGMESVFDASADEMRAARRSHGDMPLIVLTRSPGPKGPDETREQRDAKNRIWEELHDQIAGLSTRGVNRTVVDSGHWASSTSRGS